LIKVMLSLKFDQFLTGFRHEGKHGPDALCETRGYPAPARIPQAAPDEAVARRVWEASDKRIQSFG